MPSFKNAQFMGDASFSGEVDLSKAFVKGTAYFENAILSKQRVKGARFGQIVYDGTTKFVNDKGDGPYQGVVSTKKGIRGYFFVFS